MKMIRHVCWRCLEVYKQAGMRCRRIEGSTGQMQNCDECHKRRLCEVYTVEYDTERGIRHV